MENLEEVLQALDEFQKMRPTEIPRELEDYLCWVAKTGDPVYQWSLIKTLFREKLTRVMTDFYESCPSLELAPCPNVEHFNYDTMKTNLLERLESFANAPFTVQRICELLTAPRKQYNRVDKFMRAIEKNILVVSTREPGPIARRSENGDGMVNGSVDEEASVTQPPQDVEMEYWEKDCASTVTISVHTIENESPMLQTIIPTATVVKNVFGTEEVPSDKLDSTSSKSESSIPNFIPTTSEFTGVSNVASQAQSQDSAASQTMQNIPTVSPEGTAATNDVPEAVINEDTSSQPSLDLESEETDGADSSKKLQTTFQAKDFTSSVIKIPKLEEDDTKSSEKTESSTSLNTEESPICPEKSNESDDKSSTKPEILVESNEPANPVIENLLEISDQKLEEKVQSNVIPEVAQSDGETTDIDGNKSGQQVFESSDKESLSVSNGEAVHRISREEKDSVDSDHTPISEDQGDGDNDRTDQTADLELEDHAKSVVTEEISKDQDMEISEKDDQATEGLIITTVQDDATETLKSASDITPINDEPTEEESAKGKASDVLAASDIPEIATNPIDKRNCQGENEDKGILGENTIVAELQGDNTNTVVKTKDDDAMIVETNGCKKDRDQVELMEVDEEEALSMFQQGEPMEQETVELSKS